MITPTELFLSPHSAAWNYQVALFLFMTGLPLMVALFATAYRAYHPRSTGALWTALIAGGMAAWNIAIPLYYHKSFSQALSISTQKTDLPRYFAKLAILPPLIIMEKESLSLPPQVKHLPWQAIQSVELLPETGQLRIIIDPLQKIEHAWYYFDPENFWHFLVGDDDAVLGAFDPRYWRRPLKAHTIVLKDEYTMPLEEIQELIERYRSEARENL